MSQRTKQLITIVALIAAAIWFFLLRGQVSQRLAFGDLFPDMQFTALSAAHRAPLDMADIHEQAQPLPYEPAELSTQFGKQLERSDENLEDDASLPAFSWQVGESTGFWVTDGPIGETYRVTATLRYVGEYTLIYVDDQIEIDQTALEAATQDFETTVYPQMRTLFEPGEAGWFADGARLTILHTPLASAGGYFSQADTEPLQVNPFSNQRLMFVIGSDSYLPGEDDYLMILAHEFQHLIHASYQSDSPAWFNEGLSMLAQDLTGFPDEELASIFLAKPDIGLIDWSQDAAETGDHYGAAHLFMRYIYHQYVEAGTLKELLKLGAGSHRYILAQLAAETRPDIQSFTHLVADWAVTNLINDPSVGDGRFAYQDFQASVTPLKVPGGGVNTTVNQFGADYLDIGYGPRWLEFDGAEVIPLTGTRPLQGERMWWSGRGDSRVSTLTKAFDLQGVAQATLKFSAWYELERHFDYAYVTVSLDGGQTWQPLPGQRTSGEDPQGINLGNGITGVSGRANATPENGKRGRWIQERMDLTQYTGRQILLRFWVVNDRAYHAQGLLLDQISIPEIGYLDGGEEVDSGWQAQGFVRTTGFIPQEWALRLVIETPDQVEVQPVMLDANNSARIELAPGERGVIVIIGASPLTDELARYRVDIGKQ